MKNSFKNYQELQSYLKDVYIHLPLVRFDGQAGLINAGKILDKLGNPQNYAPTIHIAGTSGKGTVAYMAADLLRSSGLKVGLHVSPHVYDMRERYQVNQEMLSEAAVLEAFNTVMPLVAESFEEGKPLNYYCLQLLVAWQLFRQQKVDCIVLETGLGGLLDMTNLARKVDKICVLATIGLDHQKILGETVELIAAQKAGIIQHKNEVIPLKQAGTINDVFTEVAQKNSASISFVSGEDLNKSWVAALKANPQFAGPHQLNNFALSLYSCHLLLQRLEKKLPLAKALASISSLKLPGRFEIVEIRGKTVILDGAHNEQKLEGLISSFTSKFGSQNKAGIVFASKHNDKVKDQLKQLAKISKEFVFTKYPVSQESILVEAMDPNSNMGMSLVKSSVHSDVKEAVEHMLGSKNNIWIVTGSFYVLESVRHYLGRS